MTDSSGSGRALKSAGRSAGVVGAAIGVLAAGAAAGVAIERMTVGRAIRSKARLTLDSTGPFGTLRGTPGVAYAEDGTELRYEVEEAVPESRGRPGIFRRNGTAPLTIVFSHGYCLSQDSWHFQRLALRGNVRAVYWDQRSHGRSERGRAQRVGVAATMDQLGRDRQGVSDAAPPRG
ncbi:alpha/beta fold hydrolase, partial [Streptomyces sp. NPDC054933]